MNEREKQVVITTLERIIELGKHNDPEKGLCGLLDDALESAKAFKEVWRMMPFWPEYSGNVIFPVPAPHQLPLSTAFHTLPKWIGEYGRARIRLAEFLLQQVKSGVTPEPQPVKRPWWSFWSRFFD